jgi:hypothetical protein
MVRSRLAGRRPHAWEAEKTATKAKRDKEANKAKGKRTKR